MKFNKVIVAVDLDKSSMDTLSQLKAIPFPKGGELHLIHVFENNLISFDFFANLQLSPEQLFVVEQAIVDKLQTFKSSLELSNDIKVVTSCLIAPNAKQEFLSYADREGATLIVAAAKEREGFKGIFESSFTNFLNRFAHVNLLILRPEK